MSINLEYLEQKFSTPGYPDERVGWQWSIREFESAIRTGKVAVPKFSLHKDFRYDLLARQNTEVLLGVYFMVGLPALLVEDHFEKYARVLWEVVYAVPVTAHDGMQFEKYRFWTKRQKQLLSDEIASYNQWKSYHGSW